MDILSNLKYAEGSRKKIKRIGRGMGSGHGKTSTRGHNGAGSRSGNKWYPWFEGGQMPLQRRIPKFGFTNIFKKEFQVLNLDRIQKFIDNNKLSGQALNPEIFFESGLISSKKTPVKILGNGELKTAFDITAHNFTKSAKEKIEKIGGKAIII
jgi:large subunit ribosomal protein L15